MKKINEQMKRWKKNYWKNKTNEMEKETEKCQLQHFHIFYFNKLYDDVICHFLNIIFFCLRVLPEIGILLQSTPNAVFIVWYFPSSHFIFYSRFLFIWFVQFFLLVQLLLFLLFRSHKASFFCADTLMRIENERVNPCICKTMQSDFIIELNGI